MCSHVFDFKFQLSLITRRGSLKVKKQSSEVGYLECEMFKEVCCAGGGICFSAGSGIDPDSDCCGL